MGSRNRQLDLEENLSYGIVPIGMAMRPLVYYPSPTLRRLTLPVASLDAAVRALAADLADTMRSANGIGLAAPQVGRLERVIVVGTSDSVLTFVNPEITKVSRQREDGEEGCLSIPGVFGVVSRASQIEVRAMDLHGNPVQCTAERLLARVIQHEIDHLNGILFIDRMYRLTSGVEQLRKLWAQAAAKA